jgi:hypothetical protein
VKVTVLLVVAGFGLNPAVTPLGKPAALNVTLLLKPPVGVIVITLVAVLPCTTLMLAGLAASEKLPPVGLTVSVIVVL